MEHLGKVFREFRTSGNYSLKEAAGESCSTSQLSRFELGESDLAVFQKLQREQLEKSKSSTTPLYFELNWILLQGLICQRDASYDMKQDDLDKVADYLFKTEEWTMYELILFGNLYSFYDVDYVTRIGREVMEREEFYQEISRHKRLVLILALNCYQHCLEHSSFYNANYFEAYTEKIIDKGIKLYERNVFHYLKGFALYQKGQCKEGCKQMQETMHIFDVLGLPEQVAYYQEHYEKFVKS
ncbi:Rgg family transcriptional regulator [Streptococcus pneumoniae]|uniref:Rgg family transcriptional regulator n=1 Tax=Streptococcus pneumoniae TaxID=1313 RepID=UPI000768E923|nr:MutR family transcriptional regulator [Streptococcus pneumoniae]VSZ56401.1 transcriptional regulator MutR [Streptococcus pneumoniae]